MIPCVYYILYTIFIWTPFSGPLWPTTFCSNGVDRAPQKETAPTLFSERFCVNIDMSGLWWWLPVFVKPEVIALVKESGSEVQILLKSSWTQAQQRNMQPTSPTAAEARDENWCSTIHSIKLLRIRVSYLQTNRVRLRPGQGPTQ